MHNQWKCTAYTGKNRNVILGHTFVRALTEQDAMDLGRRALKLIGIRGRFNVSAHEYEPWRDYSFGSYLRKAT